MNTLKLTATVYGEDGRVYWPGRTKQRINSTKTNNEL